jgi:hypothetical protein
MAYRIRLLVPACYTEEARTMIEEHPRASVLEISASDAQPGCDLLTVVSSEARILHGLHRWWMDRRSERRANPPLAIVQEDGSAIDFNSHSPDEIAALGRVNSAQRAS